MAEIGKLKKILKDMENIAVAFSGGIDSTFLLSLASQTEGVKVTALTARLHGVPEREIEEAIPFCKNLGIKHIIFDFNELDIKEYRENRPQRCYHCKTALFKVMLGITKDNNIKKLVDGTNADDVGKYRPGLKALEEMGISSPLAESGFSKEDIRKYSKEMGLSAWDKPSFPCLATRFPYGEEINENKLVMVGEAEEYLKDIGIRCIRVRMHGNIARIESDEEGLDLLIRKRQQVVRKLKSLGFLYITADLGGFRSGSMDEVLTAKK